MLPISPDVLQAIETISYAGLFLWLVMYNLLFFIPFPPYELVLMTAGYVASAGLISPFAAGLAIILASILADNVFFMLSRKGNDHAERLIKKLSKNAYHKHQRRLKEHYFKSFVIITFIPKVRILGPAISGVMDVPWKRFALADALANTVTSAAYLTIGYFFHAGFQQLNLIREARIWDHALFYAVMIALAIVIFLAVKYVFSRRERAKKEQEKH